MNKATPLFPLSERGWLRGPTWLDEADRVVLDVSHASAYEPMRDSATVGLELTKVKKPEDAVAFAARFGLLTVAPLEGERHLAIREPVSTFIEHAGKLRALSSAISDVRLAQAGDREALRRAGNFAIGNTPGKRLSNVQVSQELDEIRQDEQFTLFLAANRVGQSFTKALAGCRSGIFDRSLLDPTAAPGELRIGILTRTLLDACYVSLAIALSQPRPIAVCQNCGGVFIIEDARQRHCSKQCADRVRYLRYLPKLKAKRARARKQREANDAKTPRKK